MRGLVYGDIIGSPFREANTPTRYFEAGRSRSVNLRGHVTVLHPQVTEASASAAATARWLSAGRGNPTSESFLECLQDEFDRYPGMRWSESSRALLTGGMTGHVTADDPSVLARTIPIAEFSSTREMASALTSICIGATHSNPGTIRSAQEAVMMLWDARRQGNRTLESLLPEPSSPVTDNDLKAELKGLEKVTPEMLGSRVEGAYTYREPGKEKPVGCSAVLRAAARCVDRSDSWEDAVRRAVSLGGPSDLLAAITGAAASIRFGEPSMDHSLGEVMAVVPPHLRADMEHFEKVVSLMSGAKQDMRMIEGTAVTNAQRERSMAAFGKLVGAVKAIQDELKEMAGFGERPGQARFDTAIYPFYDGAARKVTVYRGSSVMESISLGDDGMMHIANGEARIASATARTDRESLMESVMASRSILSRAMMSDPAGRIGEVIASVRGAVFDEPLSPAPDGGRKDDESERILQMGFRNMEALDRDIASEGARLSWKGFNYNLEGTRKEKTRTRTIYTMGFSTRSLDEFTGMLPLLGIDTVIDVRSVQKSRKHPHFDSARLDDALFEKGIGYIDGSANLGDQRRDCLDVEGRADWEEMRKDEGYLRSLESVKALLEKGHTVAVCSSEGSPLTSHRTATVARDLAEMGANVMHVMRNGDVTPHTVVENLLAEKYVAKGLVDGRKPWKEQVKDAYRLMNRDFGWKPSRTRDRAKQRHR